MAKSYTYSFLPFYADEEHYHPKFYLDDVLLESIEIDDDFRSFCRKVITSDIRSKVRYYLKRLPYSCDSAEEYYFMKDSFKNEFIYFLYTEYREFVWNMVDTMPWEERVGVYLDDANCVIREFVDGYYNHGEC